MLPITIYIIILVLFSFFSNAIAISTVRELVHISVYKCIPIKAGS